MGAFRSADCFHNGLLCKRVAAAPAWCGLCRRGPAATLRRLCPVVLSLPPPNTRAHIILTSLYIYPLIILTSLYNTYKKLFSISLYPYPLYSLPLSFSPLMVLGRYVWRLYCVRGRVCARVVLALVGACVGGPAVGCMRLAWQNKGRWRG